MINCSKKSLFHPALSRLERKLSFPFAQASKTLETISASDNSSVSEKLSAIENGMIDAMNDDFNSPIALSHIFEMVRLINAAADGKEKFTAKDITQAKNIYDFLRNTLGITFDVKNAENNGLLDTVIEILLQLRQEAKNKKDFALSDLIRNELSAKGIQVMDGKDGAKWKITI